MKKTLNFLLILICIIAFSSCNNNQENSSYSSESEEYKEAVGIYAYRTYDAHVDSGPILYDQYDLAKIELNAFFRKDGPNYAVFSNDEFRLFINYDSTYEFKKVCMEISGDIEINGIRYNSETKTIVNVLSTERVFALDIKLYATSHFDIIYLMDEDGYKYEATDEKELYLILNNNYIEFLDDTKLKFRLKEQENITYGDVKERQEIVEPNSDGIYELTSLNAAIYYKYKFNDKEFSCRKMFTDYEDKSEYLK